MRRFVTGTGEDGKSRIVEGLPDPGVITIEGREGFAMYNMWMTTETKPYTEQDHDMTVPKGLMPPANGTFFRIVDFPPEFKDPEEMRRVLEAQFKNQFADVAHNTEDGKNVGFHQHETIDYAIVLDGSIKLLLDDQEQDLEKGDIVIQRGVNHRWSNQTDENCRMAFIQIDARYAE